MTHLVQVFPDLFSFSGYTENPCYVLTWRGCLAFGLALLPFMLHFTFYLVELCCFVVCSIVILGFDIKEMTGPRLGHARCPFLSKDAFIAGPSIPITMRTSTDDQF